MKYFKILFLLAGFMQVSIQQSLRCYECQNCGDQNQWTRITCASGEEDDPIGAPTNPSPPLLYPVNNVSMEIPLNMTIVSVDPIGFNTKDSHRCFRMVIDVNGNHQTNRGCVLRSQENRNECDTIGGNQRVVSCDLCDYEFCNNASTQLVPFLLIAACYFFSNILL